MNPATFEYPASSTSVAGTSDIFSSTFALLSDTAPSYEQQWVTPEKLQATYYYETQPGDAFAQLQTFDAYRAANNVIPAYEAYNPAVVALPVVSPPTSYLEQALPLQVYTHQATASSAFSAPQQTATASPAGGGRRLHPGGTNTPTPTSSSAASSATSPPAHRPTSSASNNSATPPHNNNNHTNNNTTSTPPSDSPPDTVPLHATELEVGEGAEDDERVMCMACRGVYPSRRSLTGHIGRNEKCREIIGLPPASPPPPPPPPLPSSSNGVVAGRNYLEQLASASSQDRSNGTSIPPPPGTESAKAGAIVSGTDGLSPICPYCDRFISHYKGNIRRHINQCGKTGGKRPKPQKSSKESKKKKAEEQVPAVSEWQPAETLSLQAHTMPPMTSYDSFMSGLAPIPPIVSPPSQMLTPQAMEMVQPPPVMNPPAQSSLPTPNSTPVKKESDVPDDPYLCPFCDFLTVYKGNMKRHMNTCHVNEPESKDHKLDKMKASVLGVDPATLMDKINAHKANSTRGRRPKKKEPSAPQNQNQPPQTQLSTHQLPLGHLDQFHHQQQQQQQQQYQVSLTELNFILEYTVPDEHAIYGCPADPYVYPPLGLLSRPLPGLLDDPSDPLQATISHIVEPHRL